MYMRCGLLFLVLFFDLFVAASQQPYLKHFTVDDGLPSNEVYQVLQDGGGNLLAATDRGAVRFDGYEFIAIPTENKLTSKPVYYIYRSPQNSIYFSSLFGAIYHYNNDTLFDYAPSRQSASLFQHPGILIANTIARQRDTTWISYNNDYNYNYKVGSCFVTQNGEVQKLNREDGIYFDLKNHFYFRQLSASNFKTEKQSLHIIWPNGMTQTDTVDITWQGGYIRRLFYETVGDYHLFCVGRLLLVYQNGKRVGRYAFAENMLYLAKVEDDTLCIGFENKGAARFLFREGILLPLNDSILDGYSVTCIYQDQQKGIWFSTLENGLYYSYPARPAFYEGQNRIVSIQKRGTRVFVGDYNGKIQVFERGKLAYQIQLPLGGGSYLRQISFDQNDSLLVITNKGTFSRQNAGWRLQKSADAFLLPVNDTLVYGAAAASAELNVYRSPGRTSIQKIKLAKRIISMFSDAEQRLWIGTWEGLLLFNGNRLVDYGKKNSVFRDRIVAIGELPDKSLVVGSLGNGLAVCKNNRVFILNAGNGLTTPIINSMVIDKGTIWIGTNKGLAMVRFQNGQFSVVHFDAASGLPSADINEFTMNDGWLYIKWVNRLVMVEERRLLLPSGLPNTRLTAVMVNDRTQAAIDSAVFSHSQNALTFHFVCPNLAAARQQAYRYRLDGFENAWHTTRDRSVKYTNLPPGDYRFMVQAFSTGDRTLSSPATYIFSVRPAFWQTWWFLLLSVVFVVLAVGGIFQLRVKAIKQKNQLLLELAENRQKVLLQLIHPHFVFNILNTIQGAVLKQEKLQAASLVAKFAKLMRLSLELGKEKMVGLDKEIDLLTKYFELEAIRAPDRFDYVIEVEPPLQPSRILIPSMLIQPFVENAIKHGVMHLDGRKGWIRIRFHEEGKALLCTVEDNGVGRQEAERINNNRQKDHQSSGIEITVNRLRLLHREDQTAFVYKVIDQQTSTGEPAGTSILFSLPYQHADETYTRTDHR